MFRAGQPRRRLIAIFLVCSLILLVVLVRVGLVQTAEAKTYKQAGIDQRTRERVLQADRGGVFDRDGTELALSVPATTLFVNPKLVSDPTGTADVLAAVIGLSDEKRQSLIDAMVAKESSFVYVARQLDDATAQAVLELGLPGVAGYEENTRVLPAGDLARSIIGRTDPDGRGISGLEAQYDEILRGVDGEVVRQIDSEGRSIPGSGAVSVSPTPGSDIVLTLDSSIQYAAEQELLKQVRDLQARGGVVIVMDTDSGDIYAMANVRRDGEGVYRVTSANVSLVDSYEPGSVGKVITIAGALNDGVTTPDTWYEVPWRKWYYDMYLSDSHQHPTEPMSVTDILVESSNIGTITVSEQLADGRQYDYLRAFGLGERTALDFPGESVGILKPWTEWHGTEKKTVAYGHGVSSTAMQLLAAVNVIANRGTYVAPRLVTATIDPQGERHDEPPSETRDVVSTAVAAQMTTMMQQVVCSGTATRAQVEGVSIAGKTGTAYKAQANGTYYNEDGEKAYYASFVGYFPAEDPQVTVLVSIDEPPGGASEHFGGTAAAPVFATLVPTLIHELDIQPPPGSGCQ